MSDCKADNRDVVYLRTNFLLAVSNPTWFRRIASPKSGYFHTPLTDLSAAVIPCHMDIEGEELSLVTQSFIDLIDRDQCYKSYQNNNNTDLSSAASREQIMDYILPTKRLMHSGLKPAELIITDPTITVNTINNASGGEIAIVGDFNALSNASSSIKAPRALFTMTAPLGSIAKRSAFIKSVVSGVTGQCSERKSDTASKLSTEP